MTSIILTLAELKVIAKALSALRPSPEVLSARKRVARALERAREQQYRDIALATEKPNGRTD